MLLDHLRVIAPRLLLAPWGFAVYSLSLVPWPCQGLLHPDLFPPDLHFPGRACGLLTVALAATVLFSGWGILARLGWPRAMSGWLRPLLVGAEVAGLLAWLDYRTMYGGYVTLHEAFVMGTAVIVVAALGAAAGTTLGMVLVTWVLSDAGSVSSPAPA